jgi:hypothetical protein
MVYIPDRSINKQHTIYIYFYLDQVNAGDDVLDLTDQLCLGSGIELLELDGKLGLLSNLLLLFKGGGGGSTDIRDGLDHLGSNSM